MQLFNEKKYGGAVTDAWVLIHKENPLNSSQYEIIPHDPYFPTEAINLKCRDGYNLRLGRRRVKCYVVAVASTVKELKTHFKTLRENYIHGSKLSPDIKFRIPEEYTGVDYAIPSLVSDFKMELRLVGTPEPEIELIEKQLKNRELTTRNFTRSERVDLLEELFDLSYEFSDKFYKAVLTLALKINEDWRKQEISEKDLPTDNDYDLDNNSPNICIGPNKTAIPRKIYKNINWLDGSQATRKLLVTLFTREELATRTLSGKPRPGATSKVVKKQLNPTVVEDIIEHLAERTLHSRSEVRHMITAKCADENKMYKKRLKDEANVAKEQASEKATVRSRRISARRSKKKARKASARRPSKSGTEDDTKEVAGETEVINNTPEKQSREDAMEATCKKVLRKAGKANRKVTFKELVKEANELYGNIAKNTVIADSKIDVSKQTDNNSNNSKIDVSKQADNIADSNSNIDASKQIDKTANNVKEANKL